MKIPKLDEKISGTPGTPGKSRIPRIKSPKLQKISILRYKIPRLKKSKIPGMKIPRAKNKSSGYSKIPNPGNENPKIAKISEFQEQKCRIPGILKNRIPRISQKNPEIHQKFRKNPDCYKTD